MFFLLDGMVHLIHAKKKGNGKRNNHSNVLYICFMAN